jgi:hypothetical protein
MLFFLLSLLTLQQLVVAQDIDADPKDLPGMGELFIGYDTVPGSGCTTNAPVLFKKHLRYSYCYQGSPSLFRGLLYGSSSCAGPYAGSFMLEKVDNNTLNIRRYFRTDNCVALDSDGRDERLSISNNCLTSSGSFQFAFPVKIESDPGPQFAEQIANRSPKNVPVAVCPRPGPTSSTTATSSASPSSYRTTTTSASSTGTTKPTVLPPVSSAAPMVGSMGMVVVLIVSSLL